MKYPYIIAEAGSCHEGQLTRALSLIYAAKHADADAVKFQFWSSPQRMRERRKMEYPAYTHGSVEERWLPELSRIAHAVGLDFMCTAYLPEDVATVAPYVDMFKVSSFESQDEALLGAHEEYRKPIIISMGMNGMAKGGGPYYLHCVSGYPVPLDQAALQNIGRRSEKYYLGHFPCAGYSDHTRNVLTGAVAVGAGAKILEVHFRLDDTTKECADYVVALTPAELGQYVWNARQAGRMMSSTKAVQDCERVNLRHRVGV